MHPLPSFPAVPGIMNVHKTARFLGWFSLGLGLTELFATDELAHFLGTKRGTGVLRLFGLREIAAGVGLLAQPRRLPFWLWARVAGDAMDLAALGIAAVDNPRSANVLASIGAVAGVTALDIYTAEKVSVGV